MRRCLSIYIVLLFLLPAALGVVSEPVVEITSPIENEVINNNVFTISGTADGSTGHILQTTEANFAQGSHINSTPTETGEVVIFPMPMPVKQNNGDPVLTNGSLGTFDDELVSAPSVVLDGGVFHMWYSGNDGNNNRIGYATSVDGIAWTRQNGGNFVLDKGDADDWDSFSVADPWVFNDSGTWKMWYTGSNGLKNRIGYADSVDGINWNKDGSEVLDIGDSGKWDGNGVASPTVLKMGSTYHMWYIGTDWDETKMGYATSNDGTHWTKENNGNAVFSAGDPGAFDGYEIRGPAVLFRNGVYKLYYTGSSGSTTSVGLATSGNGLDWERQNNGNAVLTGTNGKFDWKNLHNPAVVADGLVERIWYSGENSTTVSLGYATATISDVGGTYTSPPFEIGGDVQFKKINWTMDNPSGTSISVEVRTQSKNKEWGTWFTPTNGNDLGGPDGWKFQYKVVFTSDDLAKTPKFKDITLEFFKPIIEIEVTTNGGVFWYNCEGTTVWTCAVEAANGARMVQARSIDSTGDHSIVKRVNVTLNGDLPEGSILVNGGAKFTPSREITLTLNATDSSGVHNMMISEDSAFGDASWIAFTTEKAFVLSEGDGWKNVNVKFMDTYGVESVIFNDSILLDTTPPEGYIKINEGADYTTDPEVVLKLSASDLNGVTGMMISEDPTFSGLSPRVFYDKEFFTLSKGDGPKSVYVRFVDTAGSYGDYHANITLDTTEPTGSIRINSNAAVTITRMVNLTITGKDKNEIVQMSICNVDNFDNCTWEPFAEYKIWELPKGSAAKVVFIKFIDEAGLESDTYSDSIVYEEPPDEGIISINDGALYTNVTNVSLTIGIGSLGTVTDMMVSNDPDFVDAEWQPHSETLAWDIIEGDGVKWVYIKFLTMAGIETEGFSDNITLDTTAPEVKVSQPANGSFHKTSMVELLIKATDTRGVDKVEVQVDGIGWEEATVNETDPTLWELDVDLPTKGPHTITVRVTDPAGNTAETQIEVTYKPKKKDDSPFLDGGLILLAIGLGMMFVVRKRRR